MWGPWLERPRRGGAAQGTAQGSVAGVEAGDLRERKGVEGEVVGVGAATGPPGPWGPALCSCPPPSDCLVEFGPGSPEGPRPGDSSEAPGQGWGAGQGPRV